MQQSAAARNFVNRLPPIVWDVVLVSLLVGLAVFLRLPHLMTIPVITDETREVLLALKIAHGQAFPLANVSTYIGPVFLYLLALTFRAFGVSPELPRLFVLGAAALTVGATYWLGKVWANRLAAVLGAGLFVTAATHIWVNSHIANSASITPLFTTLTVLALTYALKRRKVSAWILTGLLYGLALQSHPTVILVAPALVGWALWTSENRRQLHSPAPYLAIVAALLAYSPVVAHNVITWGTSRSSFSSVARRTYAFGLPENAADYFNQVQNTALDIWRAFAAQFVAPQTWLDLAQWVTLAYLVLLVGSSLYLLKRGNPLPALMLVLTPLLLALFVRTAIFPYDTRYYAFVLPVGYAAIGIWLDAGFRAIWKWKPTGERGQRVLRPGGLPPIPIYRIVSALVIALLVVNLIRLALYPLYALVGVNQFFLLNGPNSSGIIALAERARAAGTRVWLDRDLTGPDYWMCNGVTAGEALSYLLTLNAVPNESFEMDKFMATAPQWVALTPQNAAKLGAHVRMERIAATMPPGVHCAPAVIEMYEIQD